MIQVHGDTGPISFPKQSGARAYRSGNVLNLANQTPTKIQLNAESYDILGEFDNSTNFRFTAIEPGYYQVNAAVRFYSIIADKFYSLRVYKNGADYTTGDSHSSSTFPLSINISDEVYLAANDYLELYYYLDVGATTVDMYGYEYYTFMSVRKVS